MKWLINPKEWKRQLQAEAASKALVRATKLLARAMGVTVKLTGSPSRDFQRLVNRVARGQRGEP